MSYSLCSTSAIQEQASAGNDQQTTGELLMTKFLLIIWMTMNPNMEVFRSGAVQAVNTGIYYEQESDCKMARNHLKKTATADAKDGYISASCVPVRFPKDAGVVLPNPPSGVSQGSN